VEGLVLVDATHESRYLPEGLSEDRRREREKHRNLFRIGYMFSPIGLPRLLKRHIGANRLPKDVQKAVTSLGSINRVFKAAYSEFLGAEESATQIHKPQAVIDA